MPLVKANITAASRIMLPRYAALTATYGLVYLLDPLDRLHDSHSLAVARACMFGSMVPWGCVFLLVAGMLAWAWWQTHDRAWFTRGLWLCRGLWLFWAALYAVSIFTDPHASVLAPAAPLFFAAACRASATSLLRGEHG